MGQEIDHKVREKIENRVGLGYVVNEPEHYQQGLQHTYSGQDQDYRHRNAEDKIHDGVHYALFLHRSIPIISVHAHERFQSCEHIRHIRADDGLIYAAANHDFADAIQGFQSGLIHFALVRQHKTPPGLTVINAVDDFFFLHMSEI